MTGNVCLSCNCDRSIAVQWMLTRIVDVRAIVIEKVWYGAPRSEYSGLGDISQHQEMQRSHEGVIMQLMIDGVTYMVANPRIIEMYL